MTTVGDSAFVPDYFRPPGPSDNELEKRAGKKSIIQYYQGYNTVQFLLKREKDEQTRLDARELCVMLKLPDSPAVVRETPTRVGLFTSTVARLWDLQGENGL